MFLHKVLSNQYYKIRSYKNLIFFINIEICYFEGNLVNKFKTTKKKYASDKTIKDKLEIWLLKNHEIGISRKTFKNPSNR